MSIEDSENTPWNTAGTGSTRSWGDGENACVLLGLRDLYEPRALSLAEEIAADLLILAPHPTAADLLRRSLGSGITEHVELRVPDPTRVP